MKIFAQKNGAYTKQEIIELAVLLVKGGYTVRRGKMKKEGMKSLVEFIEFTGDAVKEDADAG